MMFAVHHAMMKAPNHMEVFNMVGVGISDEYISKTDSLPKHMVVFHRMEKVMIP